MDTNGNYMQNQFCSYEIALKLKELGFNQPCFGSFDLISTQLYPTRYESEQNDFYLLAPLWQQIWSFLDDNGMIIGIIFVDNVFKYTLNIENYVSDGFKDRMSAIKSATEYATSYLWNKKFSK